MDSDRCGQRRNDGQVEHICARANHTDDLTVEHRCWCGKTWKQSRLADDR
jgi:hypothetical protein